LKVHLWSLFLIAVSSVCFHLFHARSILFFTTMHQYEQLKYTASRPNLTSVWSKLVAKL